jgi:hypothetical protein
VIVQVVEDDDEQDVYTNDQCDMDLAEIIAWLTEQKAFARCFLDLVCCAWLSKSPIGSVSDH